MSSQVVVVYLVRGLYCFRYVASKVRHEQHDNMKVQFRQSLMYLSSNNNAAIIFTTLTHDCTKVIIVL